MKSQTLNLAKWDSCLFIIFWSLFFLCAPIAYGAEAEQILGFQSEITVNKDASIDITETISVVANKEKIRHGIVRRLPINYKDSYGQQHRTRYQITKVLMNGEPAEYLTKIEGSSYNIYIGNRERLLKPDIYVFTLGYHVNNAINFLKDIDELYWNITGNEWDFPILKAQADITLPTEAKILSYAAYTGAQGERGKDFIVNQTSDTSISFTTKGNLDPGEGLTIAVGFPKNIVHPPSFFRSIKDAITTGEIILLEITFLILAYFLLMWFWHGRDPRRGTIVPLFEPPLQLSPAATRFILNMGFDMKCYTVALISLATKGALTIEDNQGEYILNQTARPKGQLSLEEQSLDAVLFDGQNVLSMDNSNASIFQRGIRLLKTNLKQQFYKLYFLTNVIYSVPAWILTGIALIAAMLSAETEQGTFLFFWLFAWTLGCLFLVGQVIKNLKQLTRSFTVKILFTTLFSLAFALPFLIAEGVVLFVAWGMFPILIIPLFIIIMILDVVFYRLMKIPTKKGRELMDQLEGFKMYLKTAERYRLNMANFSNIKEFFEYYLPYAIAFDIENEWGEQFNRLVLTSSEKPMETQPSWYRGTSWQSSSFASFPVLLSSGISSALATSSIPAASSSASASGGGGSSGGGGGGGGGGGW